MRRNHQVMRLFAIARDLTVRRLLGGGRHHNDIRIEG